MAQRYPNVGYDQSAGGQHYGDPRRTNQVDELLQIFPSIAVLTNDRSILDFAFCLKDGHTVTLQILLPSLFPEHPPRFRLKAPLEHPLVDSSMNVNLPYLLEWKPQYKLVDALFQAQNMLSMPAQGAYPSHHHQQQQQPSPPASHSSQGSNNPAEMAASQLKDCINALLQQLSNEELQQCLTDRASYDALVNRAVTELKAAEAASASDDSAIRLAEQNLEREGELEDRINQVAIVRSSDYATMCELYKKKSTEHQELSKSFDIPKFVQQLNDEAQKVHEESDALLKTVLEEQTAVNDFVDDYMKMRKEYHKKDLLAKAGARLE